MSASFPEFVVEQGFDRTLVFLALSALVYVALLAGAWLVLRRSVNAPVLAAALVSTAAVLVVAVVGITLFEASALWFRSVPHGSGTQRQTASYEDFFTSARAVFFGLYASLVLLAAGSGFVIARLRTGHAAVAALGAGLAVLGYLVLTLPFVEFLNACDVGRSFIVDADC
jgi:hypothetical protein